MPLAGAEVALDVPASWEIVASLSPADAPSVADPRAALREALAAPMGRPPLARGSLVGKRVVLAVDDFSRPTPVHLFFDALLEHLLDAGAAPEDLLLLPASGVHRSMTRDEVERKVGRESLAGLRLASHDCQDPRGLVDLGQTSRGTPVLLSRHLVEADLVVCVGSIEPHLLLGFGGGLKMIVPGLAGAETIGRNHMQGVAPDRYNYVGVRESPMRLDLEEAARKLDADLLLVNAILDRELRICRFACGDPVAAHRAGVDLVESVAGRSVAEPVDVAVVASNPLGSDLRQGMKCIGNVAPAVREGGLVMALLECRDGVGDVTLPRAGLPHGMTRAALRLAGKDRILWLVDRVRGGVGIEERFLAHFSMQVARTRELLVYSPNLPPSIGRRLGVARQLSSAEALVGAGARYAPRHARVLVFPYGGATYPVMAGGVSSGR